MFCIECGKEVEDDARFCSFCGARILPINDKNDICQNSIIKSEQRMPHSKRKLLLLPILVALIVVAVVVSIGTIGPFRSTSDIYVSEITLFESDSESYIYEKYEYNDENQLVNIIYYNKDGTIDYIQEYDSHGNVIQETYICDGEYADYEYKYDYTYDNNGYANSCIKTEYRCSYSADGSELGLEEENTFVLEYDYEFNSKGDVVQKIITYNNDYAWRFVYEYNGDKIETEYQYCYEIGNENDERLRGILGYEYNKKGRTTKCVQYSQKGMVNSWSRWYEYEYVKSDNLYRVGELSGYLIGDTSSIAINETNFPGKEFRQFVGNELDRDQDGTLSVEERNYITADMNHFLSDFSMLYVFDSNGFDVNNVNLEDAINFAYLYCYIIRDSGISMEGGYRTISLDLVNDVLYRYLGINLTENQIATIQPFSTYCYASSGKLYFIPTDGESYNRFTVVKQVDSLPDGTYGVSFDVYDLDLNEYWVNGISERYYSLSAEEAQSQENLTLCHSGTAKVRTCDDNGRTGYQLISYKIDNEIDNEIDIAERITVKQSVLELLRCKFGEIKALYPDVEPEFEFAGRYFVKIPGTGLYLGFQNYDWIANDADHCLSITGHLSNLTDNMPSQIDLSEFNRVFGTVTTSPGSYENYYEIVRSPGTAAYISSEHYAKLYFCVDAYESGGLLEIDLDSVADISGKVILEDSFTGRISIIAG